MGQRPKEVIADHYPRRASLSPGEITYRNQRPSQPPSPVRAGTNAGSHPENMPYSTTSTTQRVSPHNTNAGEEEETSPQRMPSSARRYNAQTVVPVTHIEQRPFSFRRFLLLCGVVIVSAIALANIFSFLVVPTVSNVHDTLTYGYPRTYQV